MICMYVCMYVNIHININININIYIYIFISQIRCKDVQGDKPPRGEYAKRSNHQDDQVVPVSKLLVAWQDAEHEEEKFSSAFRLFRTLGTAASVEKLSSTTSSKFGHRLCACSFLQDAETQAYSRFFQSINV